MSEHTHCCSCAEKGIPCGCCAGVEAVTPESIANRPGLDALRYRVGTHATFFETMQARLSTMCLGSDEDCLAGKGPYPLAKLATRDTDDPSIALLDAWATVADVLTFYQERIANEGFLRTATERRSILELARLVGYQLRPGVAASVYLALTVDDEQIVPIDPLQLRAQSVPNPGELPQTFENVEKFEARGKWSKLEPRTSRPQSLKTLADQKKKGEDATIYLKGISTGLNQNDPLLLGDGGTPELYRVITVNADAAANRTSVVVRPWLGSVLNAKQRALHAIVSSFDDSGVARPTLDALTAELRIKRTNAEVADFVENETLPALERLVARRNVAAALRERLKTVAVDITNSAAALRERELAAAPEEPAIAVRAQAAVESGDELSNVIGDLTKPASVPPANTARLQRSSATAFGARSDLGAQAAGVFQPALRDSLPVALSTVTVTPPLTLEVYALRVKTAPFGDNAPLHSQVTQTPGDNENDSTITTVQFTEWTAQELIQTEFAQGQDRNSIIYLDGSYDKILSDSWIVVDTSAVDAKKTTQVLAAHPPLLIARVGQAQANISRAAYGLSGKSTRIELASPEADEDAAWIAIAHHDPSDDFQIIRRTVVYAQAEELPTVEEPIDDPICNDETNNYIVLDGIYSELKTGRWVIFSGERTDLTDNAGNPVTGVKGSEPAMIADVIHNYDPDLPGDTVHTQIKLAKNLEYCYSRDKVTIYANVVKATHGESKREVLGSGDGSKSFQRFALRQPPLTYVSAPTPAGIESTLKIFVDDVEWHVAPSIFGLQATDRRFTTIRNNDEATTAIFGNGKQGARLPTGAENVRAEYRQGIGKGGNVQAEQISLLVTRPLGVKEVINPLRATGGADAETRDQARKNVPIAVLALDRLVSTEDYSDFSRTFGGVGKAFAERLSDGRRELVHVTIAGVGDAPIGDDSDVLRNLRLALRQFGDPALPIEVAVRELKLLIISANVRLEPDYVWETVAPKIRATLLDTFSFENRELGQDALLSEVISAMQSVTGVAYVDVDAFGGIDERNPDGSVRTPSELLAQAQTIINKDKPDQRVPVNLPELPNPGQDLIRPAQLAYLTPDVPDTLILNLIEDNGN